MNCVNIYSSMLSWPGAFPWSYWLSGLDSDTDESDLDLDTWVGKRTDVTILCSSVLLPVAAGDVDLRGTREEDEKILEGRGDHKASVGSPVGGETLLQQSFDDWPTSPGASSAPDLFFFGPGLMPSSLRSFAA